MSEDRFIRDLRQGTGEFDQFIRLEKFNGGVEVLHWKIPRHGAAIAKWNSSYGMEFQQKFERRFHGKIGIVSSGGWRIDHDESLIRIPTATEFIGVPSDMRISSVVHLLKKMRANMFIGDVIAVVMTTMSSMGIYPVSLMFTDPNDLVIWNMFFAQNSTETIPLGDAFGGYTKTIGLTLLRELCIDKF